MMKHSSLDLENIYIYIYINAELYSVSSRERLMGRSLFN